MTIKDILTHLETSTHPVAKAIHKGDHFKVLVIGFRKGMVLKDHEAHLPSKLVVLSGQVIYREMGQEVILSLYDEYDIHPRIRHSVEAMEDSLCLLSQG